MKKLHPCTLCGDLGGEQAAFRILIADTEGTVLETIDVCLSCAEEPLKALECHPLLRDLAQKRGEA